MVLDDRVDDQPALRIGRPDEPGADHVPDAARAAVAADDELRRQAALALRGLDPDGDGVAVLLDGRDGARKTDGDPGKPRQALEERLLEIRLVERAERRAAVKGALGEVHVHERRPLGVQIADVWILNEAGLDALEEADLREKPQRFRIIGDRARKPEQAGAAFEDDDPNSREAQEIGDHEPDRSRSHDGDFNRTLPHLCVILPVHSRLLFSEKRLAGRLFCVYMYVISTFVSIRGGKDFLDCPVDT